MTDIKKSVLLLWAILAFACKHKPEVVNNHNSPHVIYPKVVYNNCTDEYAVMTDSGMFFGKTLPEGKYLYYLLCTDNNITFSGGVSTYSIELPPPPPPALVSVSFLHDTLEFTKLGGEFQFKDSAFALKSYLTFYKECKDSENLWNLPIRKQITHYWDSANAKRRKDSIAGRKQFVIDSTEKSRKLIEDSIFKCQHTYQ